MAGTPISQPNSTVPASSPAVTKPQTSPRSLFQQVQSNLQQMAAPQAAGAGVLGSTEEIRRISQAATGKMAPAGTEGPQRDAQQELAVVDQVQQGQQAIARDSQLSQLAMQQADQQIQNEAQFQEAKLTEDELNRLDLFHETQSRILQDYTTNKRQLDLNKDKARLEQLGFTMRLSDAKYVNQLQQQANRARLSDAARFEEELTRTIFAEETELLRDNLDFRALMNADQRQFDEATAKMSSDYAMAIANAQNREASERTMWSGISGVISAGAQVATSDTGKKWLDKFFATETPGAYQGTQSPTWLQDNLNLNVGLPNQGAYPQRFIYSGDTGYQYPSTGNLDLTQSPERQ